MCAFIFNQCQKMFKQMKIDVKKSKAKEIMKFRCEFVTIYI